MLVNIGSYFTKTIYRRKLKRNLCRD